MRTLTGCPCTSLLSIGTSRDPLKRRVGYGIDGTGEGGVVDRGVAEGAHGDRVARPRARDAEFGGASDAHCHTESAGEVRRDRGRLRNDGQFATAEDLVPSAGDGFLGGCDHAEEHIAYRVDVLHLAGPRAVERPGAVMQEGRIGGA
jgi:hypothetical protein